MKRRNFFKSLIAAVALSPAIFRMEKPLSSAVDELKERLITLETWKRGLYKCPDIIYGDWKPLQLPTVFVR